MNKTLSFLFVVVFLGGALVPSLAFAGDYIGSDGTLIHYEGLVPCGKSQPAPGESQEVTNPCTICHFFVMIDGIIKFLLGYIVPALAALMIAIGGGMYVLSRGDPEKLSQAKKLFASIAIGMVIIYGAWLIINLFFAIIGFSEFGLGLTGPDKWFKINCP